MALELARLGLNIVLVGRDPAKLHDTSEAISKTAGTVVVKTVILDLALVATLEGDDAMRRLREAVTGLDVGVLVNNAGVATPHAVCLHEADVEAWVRMLRVNVWALTEVTAAVLPGMVERGRGAVVNIGSGSGCLDALPSFRLYAVYSASKKYVAQFSRSLYVEYRSSGIDVQCQANKSLYVQLHCLQNLISSLGFLRRQMTFTIYRKKFILNLELIDATCQLEQQDSIFPSTPNRCGVRFRPGFNNSGANGRDFEVRVYFTE